MDSHMVEDLPSLEIKDLKAKREVSIEVLVQEAIMLITEIIHHQEVTVEKGLNQLINQDLIEEIVLVRVGWDNTLMLSRSLSKFQGQVTTLQYIITFPSQL